LLQLAAAQNARPNLRFARDYSFRELKANNAILLGNGRSNPWVQPFEVKLGLRWEFDKADGVYYPVDTRQPSSGSRTARPGEAHEGYFSLALLPNLGSTGNVLLVAATGGSATIAAADFLSDEKSLHELRGKLPPGNSTAFPAFEALVKTQGRNGGARETHIEFCRALGR
jgi:hypothetical protein